MAEKHTPDADAGRDGAEVTELAAARPAPTSEAEVIDALTRVLARACRKLGEAGAAHEAGRLAAAGWAAVRVGHARQARHLDGVMHHIARLEAAQEEAAAPRPSPGPPPPAGG